MKTIKNRQPIKPSPNPEVNPQKKTVLQRYYEEGYLDMPDSQFTAEDRRTVGDLLARDYYLGNYDSMQTARWRAVAIASTGEYTREQALYYKERYLRAIKTIPAEFWPAVRRVCIDDLPVISDKYRPIQSTMYKHEIYHQKMLLNLGLERLIYFYFKKF
ncbi:MAG: hypothetical protein IJ099_02425 [Alphaproteobacteria bacterium]|nr:hypothetical protein [Alphaproteobacteria bacterium]